MVEQLLNKYKNDIVMLDSILQWALNPTPKSSGYGLEENYEYIMNNLKVTYNLSIEETEEIVFFFF